jgi:hypothetical protein
MPPVSSVVGLKLQSRFIEGDTSSLRFEWTLENASPRSFVVLRYLHRTFDDQGRLLPEPDLAYISVTEDGIVNLSKKVLQVPSKGIHVFTPFVPLGVELAPGSTMTETVRTSVPVASWDPYDELIQMTTGYRAMQKVQAKAISFHLAVYPIDPGGPAPTRVETNLGPLIYPNYQPVLDAQVVLDAPLVPWAGEAYR